MTGIAAGLGALVGVALGWWGALAVAAIALVAVSGRDRWTGAASVLAIFAAVAGAWRADDGGQRPHSSPALHGLVAVTVVDAPVEAGRWQQFSVESVSAGTSEGLPEIRRECIYAPAVPLVRLGDALNVTGRRSLAGDLSVGQRAFLDSRGCEISTFATAIDVIESKNSFKGHLADLRSRIGAVLRRGAPGDSGVLLSGLVTGDDSGFSERRRKAFVSSGTTHLTAVSGSNLALVVAILASIGTSTVGRHQMGWQIATILGLWSLP
jgi:competence protein ComEC